MEKTADSSSKIDGDQRIPVAVGACLVGHKVRFNGEAKRPSVPLRDLEQLFDLRPVCPEVGIGLGVPRPTIRLVGEAGRERAVDSDTGTRDVTAALRDYAAERLAAMPEIAGYVFVKGSPSCGMARVKRYAASGNSLAADGVGVYAAAIMAANPLLPVEEDGRLFDDGLRESFVLRVLTYHAWQQLCARGLSPGAVMDFWARRKYLVLGRSQAIYRQLGPLVAGLTRDNLQDSADALIRGVLSALAQPVSRRGHTNVLMHLQGYLKRHLDSAQKLELSELIDQYRQGAVPLVAPMVLMQHYFREYPDPYIERQLFMAPYPAQLGLRNRL
ncbi:MAG TPA: DUF523 and DUF1722 domain-containing protein [Spongiibacteraceae bacterium]|jgi:uncharacterized protein YbgA (DUF1722 family)/uncharacterized protein YbbK (DUF523 family)|nr:DUF523 and DUF1722 domain-containing protein [Spongiibacteraceae bacterium]HUH36305.1 DUF523 and DUF1722 domain-containing protein [Spongiibacteraceae bacterium]